MAAGEWMRFWGFSFLVSLFIPGASFAEVLKCAGLLGNPFSVYEETEPIHSLSNRSLLTIRVGTLTMGKSPLLNEALTLAAQYGVQVIVVRTEALELTPFYQRAAERMNEAGAFYTPGGDPVLVLGVNLKEEFAVHEITHLKDYIKTVQRFEALGLAREAAMQEADMNRQSLVEHYAWERAAITNQLKNRYKNSGFDLWDANLIERLTYPESSLLISRNLILRGSDDGMESNQVMDRAIWKAMVVQRLRFIDLKKSATHFRQADKEAEARLLDLQAQLLKRVTTLFDQLFPPDDLSQNQRQMVAGLFSARFAFALKKLKELKENSFVIDAE